MVLLLDDPPAQAFVEGCSLRTFMVPLLYSTAPPATRDSTYENLECTGSATFQGEEKPKSFTGKMKTITTRNSPLWKQQPKQQLGYFATRAWAHLHCFDVLMGVTRRKRWRKPRVISGQPMPST
jgi:hypothetical protein